MRAQSGRQRRAEGTRKADGSMCCLWESHLESRGRWAGGSGLTVWPAARRQAAAKRGRRTGQHLRRQTSEQRRDVGRLTVCGDTLEAGISPLGEHDCPRCAHGNCWSRKVRGAEASAAAGRLPPQVWLWTPLRPPDDPLRRWAASQPGAGQPQRTCHCPHGPPGQ